MFMNWHENLIVEAIHTASLWHSDKKGNGLALLQLSSTRKVHSEVHRAELILEIDQAVGFTEKMTGFPLPIEQGNEVQKDLRRLRRLRQIVEQAPVGEEWISFAENNRINDILYERGEL